jgi:flagellar hook-associated protein 3 FlgL
MSVNSFSRTGSANTYDNAQRNLMTRQGNLASAQENLTSGKRVVRASDDPTSAAQAERALNRIGRIATDQRALEAQRTSIVQAESALGDVTEALQRFRELVVTAGNVTYSDSERKTITVELRGLRDQVLALSNRTDTKGQPLFGALGSAAKPFVGPNVGTPDYTFNGLPGQSRSSEVGIAFSLDGDSAFMLRGARDAAYNVTVTPGTSPLRSEGITVTNPALINSNTYTISNIVVTPDPSPATTSTATYDLSVPPAAATSIAVPSYATGAMPMTGIPGLSLTITGTPGAGESITVKPSPSIFSVMDDAIRDIGGATSSGGASQAISQGLKNLDIGMNRISAVRGQAGELLNRADRISDNQGKRSIQMEVERSRAEDLDMIKGISDFQNQQTGYQAALQSYAQIQKLSLFNYIG